MGDKIDNEPIIWGKNFPSNDGVQSSSEHANAQNILKSTYMFGLNADALKELNDLAPGDISMFGTEIICEPDALYVEKPKIIKPIEIKNETESTPYKPVTQKYGIDSTFCTVNEMKIDEEIFNQALNNIVPKNSVLRDKGKTFLYSASDCVFQEVDGKRTIVQNDDKKSADPFLLVGISLHESARGTSRMATDGRNNIAGFAGMKFSSPEACIEYLGAKIDQRVQQNNLTTVVKLGKSGKYCAKNVGLAWSSRVTIHANTLREEYNRLLAEKYGNK